MKKKLMKRLVAIMMAVCLMAVTTATGAFAATGKTAAVKTAETTAADAGLDLSAYVNKLTDLFDGAFTGDPVADAGNLLANAQVYNLLIVGVDSRVGDYEGRSDAMMVLSVNPLKQKLVLTSLLRDSWVNIPGRGEDRLNAAYEYGGIQLLKKTIRQNYGIKTDAYVVVNFQDLINFVDDIGGIDMALTKAEVKVVNQYTSDQNKELYGNNSNPDALPVKSATFHLNGMQALAYARVRYVGQDFGRTERQRKVISASLKTLFALPVDQQLSIVVKYMQRVRTDLTVGELLFLVLVYATIDQYETSSIALPADGTYQYQRISGKEVIAVDFEANRTLWKNAVGA